MELLNYKDKRYLIVTKIHASQIEEPSDLIKRYGADLVLSKDNIYWILEEIIEAEFTEIKEKKEKCK